MWTQIGKDNSTQNSHATDEVKALESIVQSGTVGSLSLNQNNVNLNQNSVNNSIHKTNGSLSGGIESNQASNATSLPRVASPALAGNLDLMNNSVQNQRAPTPVDRDALRAEAQKRREANLERNEAIEQREMMASFEEGGGQ